MVFPLLFALFKNTNAQSCDIPCGDGNVCILRRSTCEYPPCPLFPICVPDVSSFINVTETPVHPGICPAIFRNGPCIQACSTDGDCRANQKCCDTGCGSICRVSVSAAAPKKTGYCKRRPSRRSLVDCSYNCDRDGDCPGRQKCCPNSCGSMCEDPCYYLIPFGQRSSRKSLLWKMPFVCRF